MGTGIRKRPGTKQLPYLSHEFVIQNHGDIATCLCMVFVIGLMFQTTAPLASSFISPSYNVSDLSQPEGPFLYTYGFKDVFLVFFYTITAVIFHAIIQEYILDKMLPKKSLSKTKEKKFNESGQLFAFYGVSALWALYILKEEGYFQSISFLWTNYPHVGITFLTKFFFILQLSYWVHVLPELYFQKVKREEMSEKIVFAAVNFLICSSIYILNFTRIGLVLLSIDYTINSLYHLSKLLNFLNKNRISRISFNIYNVSFVLARLATIVLSIFVFWFGLKSSSVDRVDFQEGNFNTPFVRLVCLGGILTLQAFNLWNFIMFHCKQRRENSKPVVSSNKTSSKSSIKTRRSVRGGETSETSDVDSEREVVSQSATESKKSN